MASSNPFSALAIEDDSEEEVKSELCSETKSNAEKNAKKKARKKKKAAENKKLQQLQDMSPSDVNGIRHESVNPTTNCNEDKLDEIQFG